jgi:hypothetical protein
MFRGGQVKKKDKKSRSQEDKKEPSLRDEGFLSILLFVFFAIFNGKVIWVKFGRNTNGQGRRKAVAPIAARAVPIGV